MSDSYKEYIERINIITSKMDGKLGKKNIQEIKGELDYLKRCINSNTNFTLKCFNEAMEKTVTEAKQDISSYIDNKVQTLGIETLREKLQISIEK
jgi:Tfp pilus assembly major pilin PilA